MPSARFSNVLLDPDASPVVGHRGAAAHAPENTLQSFERALVGGADALEFDVHVTADGTPVVHHDATVDRTTGGTGPIATMSLNAVRALDAGARFTADGGRSYPFRGQGVRVPTLEEVLGAFPAVPMIVEVKTPRASAAVRAVLERHGAAGRCIIDAFDHACLLPFRDSTFTLGATRRDVAWLLAATLAGTRVRRTPYRALCVPPRYRGIALPLARFARVLRPLGATVHVWTIDEPAQARALWAAGVQGVITNDPTAMVRARGRTAASR